MSEKPKDVLVILNKKNFSEVIKSGRPVFIDFWAEWCMPCKIMHPIFAKLAEKYSSRITFGRLNTDENSEVAAMYQVYGIPSFIMFLNGEPVDRVVGAVGEAGLEKVIQKYI
ncbi:MAG: thioredoxin [Nitrososphaeria archaeon]|nr:thioredoxin [Nitrososphaeria archaeon]NIN53433.1 thioredoxin [Nitrososphaeria archaeon]NIQ33948.1 thioredoxin [Nitrososphaeria archaeon]